MQFSKFAFALTLSLIARASSAANDPEFLAKVFDPDSNKQKLMFTYKHTSEAKGDARVITNVYSDADGKLAAVETVEFVKDGEFERVRKYHMSQKQLGAEGKVEIKDGKVLFTYERDGKTKTDDEKLTDNFVVGPSITAYLQRNWEQIARGGRVPVRMAVPDRAETVGFEFFRDRTETVGGQKVYVLKMKPSSFLIAALVKPLFFHYTADGSKLIEVHGRTQVKQRSEDKWKDLDAVTVYEYAAASSGGNSK